MKKFKHKPTAWRAETHPSVPHHYRLTSPNTDGTYSVPAKLIENSSDWIEQPEKDYEILDVVGMMEDRSYEKIHSVKRLSDGEVFSLRDHTNYGIITQFKEVADIILVDFAENDWRLKLEAVQKSKRKPVLTTEDEVELLYRLNNARVLSLNDIIDVLWSSAGEKQKLNILKNRIKSRL